MKGVYKVNRGPGKGAMTAFREFCRYWRHALRRRGQGYEHDYQIRIRVLHNRKYELYGKNSSIVRKSSVHRMNDRSISLIPLPWQSSHGKTKETDSAFGISLFLLYQTAAVQPPAFHNRLPVKRPLLLRTSLLSSFISCTSTSYSSNHSITISMVIMQSQL